MIGVSLQYKKLLFTDDKNLKPEVLLPKLWERNVRSIELRAIAPSEPASNVLRVANILWDYGFQVTVHTQCKTVENAVAEMFEPLSDLLAHMRQRELVIVQHPVVGDNAAMLNSLADYAESHQYPVRIALENNRKMPDGSNGDSVALVLDAVSRVNRPNVGICFDMGHFAWYVHNFTDTPDALPPRDFLKRAIHTHIHAYTEGATHFPIDEWKKPLSSYVGALDHKYLGVYNIELTPKRFSHLMDATEGYLCSVDTLKANLPSYVAFHDEMRAYYDDYFKHALEIFKKRDGYYASLIAPASYLFSTNGYHWAMDVSFLYLRELAETPSRVREYLGNLDLMLLTHGHGDHTEEETIRALCDTEISWVVPECIAERVLEFGVRREKMTVVRAGDDITVGPLHIRVLEGRHFRPNGAGMAAVGYLVSTECGPSIAFPSDVRDYRVSDGEELNADHCFAHVWLTDRALDPEAYVPKSTEFAKFMLNASKKSIFLTHLYINRDEGKRWTVHHARIAANAIREQSPQTVVRTPRYGEIFDLSVK